jgi:hypothetical protein
MLLVTLMAAAAAFPTPKVIATLAGKDLRPFGIVAEVVERPVGENDESFAQKLADAEGIKPWNGQPLRRAAAPRGVGGIWIYAADGRAVSVFFVLGDARRKGHVCRIRERHSGGSLAGYRAERWCAASFGTQLPERRPPPIAGQ